MANSSLKVSEIQRFSRIASNSEVAFIAITFVVLPLFEAPKNVFVFLFFVIWCFEAGKARSLGQRSPFDMPILGLAAILWVAPLTSEYGDIITLMDSAPRWTMLAFFVVAVARLDYSRGHLFIVWGAFLCGTVLAVFESFWVWNLNDKPYPEFRSVGHVNHSALYTLAALGAALPAIVSNSRYLAFAGVLATIAVFLYLPPSKSGVALIGVVTILTCFVLLFIYSKVNFSFLVFLGVATICLSVGALSLFGGDLWDEFTRRIASSNPSSGRLQYLQIAFEVYDRNALFGTGWSSFSLATSEEVLRDEVSKSGRVIDFRYAGQPHGHNLWTTMLVERGVVGVGLVTVLLFVYFKTLLPVALGSDQSDRTDRAIAVGALLVAVGFTVAGLGNTTMMNEHGHAGMAFIAVAYGYLRGRGMLPSNSG